MQIERDELVSIRNKKARDFNVARSHFDSNRPTKYYYRLPGTKYDAIKRLRQENGTIITATQDILQECHDYYSKLYRKIPDVDAHNETLQWKFLKHIPAVMDIEYYQQLDADLSKDEMYQALKKMKVEASPGLDGLTVQFYLQFWHKVGDLVFNSAKCSFQNQTMSNSQRRGLLWLIPKKAKDPMVVGNWRPITLLNVDYKIVSKTLALRLATVLPNLISLDQKGFIWDRYIGDNIYELYSILLQAD